MDLPPLEYPWRSEWDDYQQIYVYINDETNERSFEHPFRRRRGWGESEYVQEDFQEDVVVTDNRRGGYGESEYIQENVQEDFVEERRYAPRRDYQYNEYVQEDVVRDDYYDDQRRRPEYGAFGGGAAGVVVGAVGGYEGERVYDDYEREKYRVEGDVMNLPENAARWTGEEVQRVEDFPQDVEYKVGEAVQGVMDIPQDVSGWVGRKVGDVERFDDNVEYSYDAGRDEERYDDYERNRW